MILAVDVAVHVPLLDGLELAPFNRGRSPVYLKRGAGVCVGVLKLPINSVVLDWWRRLKSVRTWF